ncbi:hypothetical protein [uncultured Methanoregula sp.]|uniref:hypothetical protein n=1 Tax=uncultured Methanoregula sp. TaxID=1005933 RepID=UPI002AAB6CAD|nr:hypothetical protein [uncultured Methanoregula sp.]
MDRIIRLTLALFVIILVSFSAVFMYTAYVGNAYRSSLSSTYTYTCTFSTDSPLYNVTFFIPVPANKAGNSPMVSRISAHDIPGMPELWQTTLFDSGKMTMLKITTPSIVPPAGTTKENPYVIRFGTELATKGPIDTADPILDSAMFRPVQNVQKADCRKDSPAGSSCFTYITSFYADYSSNPNAEVRFTSGVIGDNSWKIFEPQSNEYRTDISLLMFGENHGWTSAQGFLERGIGSHDAPFSGS